MSARDQDKHSTGHPLSLSKGAAALSALLLAVALSACTAQAGDTEFSPAAACDAAGKLSAMPTADSAALTEATIAFANELPQELQKSALALAQPTSAGELGSEAILDQNKDRMRALLEVQTWTLEQCGGYVTVGAPADEGLDPANAKLADFETVVGEDEGGVYVSVLGISSPSVALELCRQAVAERSGADAPAELHVQVLDPVGTVLAAASQGIDETLGATNQECVAP